MCNMRKPLQVQEWANQEVSNRVEFSSTDKQQRQRRERYVKRRWKMKLKTRTAALRSTTAVRCEFYFSSFLSGKQACWINIRNFWAAPQMQRWPRGFIW